MQLSHALLLDDLLPSGPGGLHGEIYASWYEINWNSEWPAKTVPIAKLGSGLFVLQRDRG
jgi:hypothetical protein